MVVREDIKIFDTCPNCDMPLRMDDNFCAHCGQKNIDYRTSFKSFIKETLGRFFNLDNKILLTLFHLIKNPGKLSADYVLGKRDRYIHPFRLFLFLSFVFFLLLNAISRNKIDEESTTILNSDQNWYFNLYNQDKLYKLSQQEFTYYKDKPQEYVAKAKGSKLFKNPHSAIAVDSIKNEIRVYIPDTVKVPYYDNMTVALGEFRSNWRKKEYLDSLVTSVDKEGNFITKPIYRKVIVLNALSLFSTEMDLKEIASNFIKDFYKVFSYFLLIFLPISALIFYLIFYQERKYFYESLIFNIYLHIVLLTFYLAYYLLDYVLNAWITSQAMIYLFIIFIFFYVTYAIKTFYSIQKGSQLILKSGLFFGLYAFLIVVSLVLIALYSVLTFNI